MAHFPQLSYVNFQRVLPWIPLESLGICHGQPCSIPRGCWRTRLLSWFLPHSRYLDHHCVIYMNLTNLEIIKQLRLKWVHPREIPLIQPILAGEISRPASSTSSFWSPSSGRSVGMSPTSSGMSGKAVIPVISCRAASYDGKTEINRDNLGMSWDITDITRKHGDRMVIWRYMMRVEWVLTQLCNRTAASMVAGSHGSKGCGQTQRLKPSDCCWASWGYGLMD